MDNQTKGIALIVVALVIAVTVYALRPPSGFGDAMMRVSQNPNALFLKPPVYYAGLVVAAIIAVFGLVKLTDRSADE